MGELKDRIQSQTPGWFKRIITAGLCLSAAGTAILTAPAVIHGFVLSATINTAAQWMIVAGLVASAVSKTACNSNSDSSFFK